MGSIAVSVIHLLIKRGRVQSTPFFRGNLLGSVLTSIGSVAGGYYMLSTSDPIRNYDRAFRYVSCSVNLMLGFKPIARRIDVISIPSWFLESL